MKHILITGCSSGIGLCAARVLQQRGYYVIATVRQTEDQQRLMNEGITTIMMDLALPDSVAQGFDTALQLFNGRIDGLFNNAAFGQPGAVEDLSRDTLKAQFETNVFGTQDLTNRVIAQMRQQGHGRIVYNSSVLGIVSMAYRGAYNASKYAIEGLADTLRIELANTDIHVSLIEPGPILSRFRSNAFAKYQANINKDSSPHKTTYEAMERRLTLDGPAAPFTLGPEAVVNKCIHAFESTDRKSVV